MAAIDLNLNPGRTDLRVFGAAALVAFGTLAALTHWHWQGPEWLSVGLGALAVLSGLLALVAPAANRPLYVVLMIAVYPIGLVVSYIVLAVVFFGILTPVGLVFRLIRRDELRRRFDPDASTYWVDRPAVTDTQRYFRQF